MNLKAKFIENREKREREILLCSVNKFAEMFSSLRECIHNGINKGEVQIVCNVIEQIWGNNDPEPLPDGKGKPFNTIGILSEFAVRELDDHGLSGEYIRVLTTDCHRRRLRRFIISDKGGYKAGDENSKYKLSDIENVIHERDENHTY